MNIRQAMDRMLRHKERLDSPKDGVESHIAEYRGKRFKVTISTERRGEQLQVGGFVVQVQLTIVVRRTELDPTLDASISTLTADSEDLTSDGSAAEPRSNFDITLVTRARDYRIARVSLNSAESHFSLDCVDPYTP